MTGEKLPVLADLAAAVSELEDCELKAMSAEGLRIAHDLGPTEPAQAALWQTFARLMLAEIDERKARLRELEGLYYNPTGEAGCLVEE